MYFVPCNRNRINSKQIKMTIKERLLAQEQLIYLILERKYIPQRSQQNFNEVLICLREINPALNYQPSCTGCLMEIANNAKFYINKFKEELVQQSAAQFMTFPKQEPEVKNVLCAGEYVKECIEPIQNKKRGRPKTK